MSDAAQTRATRNYRARLAERGFARFEVLAREGDRELIRAIARRLAGDGRDAAEIRVALERLAAGDGTSRKGGILAALRRSPMVGADLDLERPREEGREVDL